MLRGNSGTSALRRAGRLEDAGRPNAPFLFSEKRESEHKWLVLIKSLLDFYILRRSEFRQGIIRGMKRYDFPAKKKQTYVRKRCSSLFYRLSTFKTRAK